MMKLSPGISIILFLTSAISLNSCTGSIPAVNNELPAAEISQAQESHSNPTLAEKTIIPNPLPDPTKTNRTADADVIQMRAFFNGESWTFEVTVAHPDLGWEDYTNGWDLLTPDGTVIKINPADPFTRTLLHPHENEQPFTRSQSGLFLPPGVTEVRVRAHDLLDGFGGQEILVNLENTVGDGYEVIRK